MEFDLETYAMLLHIVANSLLGIDSQDLIWYVNVFENNLVIVEINLNVIFICDTTEGRYSEYKSEDL